MQRTLREHITNLEAKIATFNQELDSPHRSSFERSEMMIDLGIAERSLIYFKKAYELERKISC